MNKCACAAREKDDVIRCVFSLLDFFSSDFFHRERKAERRQTKVRERSFVSNPLLPPSSLPLCTNPSLTSLPLAFPVSVWFLFTSFLVFPLSLLYMQMSPAPSPPSLPPLSSCGFSHPRCGRFLSGTVVTSPCPW